ncbi:MAG: tyrosine-type recombinase/integrase, partial [Planctomycetota bacterium]
MRALLKGLCGDIQLICCLLYGTGLRVREGLRLRVKDVDFGANQIVVRDGKGRKDRLTMLPERLKDRMGRHMQRVRELHQKDLAEGWGKVVLPHALNRKYK